jgi:hypothetical protein
MQHDPRERVNPQVLLSETHKKEKSSHCAWLPFSLQQQLLLGAAAASLVVRLFFSFYYFLKKEEEEEEEMMMIWVYRF